MLTKEDLEGNPVKAKRVIIVSWSQLPKALRDWCKEILHDRWQNDSYFKMYTELPVSTLNSMDEMREHMLASWRLEGKEIDTDIQLLDYLSDNNDFGGIMYQILRLFPKVELTDETVLMLDSEW